VTIVVFDIDGVLADATHRQHLVQQRPKDWAGFFAAVGDDPVIDAGRKRLLTEAVDHEIVLVSGRPEHTRADTVAWLERNGFGPLQLILRNDNDHRRAAVAKLDLVESLGAPGQITRVIDDDESVVKALADKGYPAELFST
jgi:phosphoglycolate phosphatase-like HAD superfamily hydrolase